MRPLPLSLLVLVCLAQLAPLATAQPTRILFIRGGSGTGGFLEGGADEQLSDIFDESTANTNHGFGQLRQLLEAEGHIVGQAIEGPIRDNTPVDLAGLPLFAWDVIVFGSNNAEYDAGAAQLLADWVSAGGAALFISDANWGTDWGDAPTSDQVFLDHFDLVMNQDKGTYVLDEGTGDFAVPDHWILEGPDDVPNSADDVSAFDGEGVSPISIVDSLVGVDPVVLVPAEDDMKLNDSSGSGTTVPTGPDDGALVALEYGLGRVVGHFDRNTFFNENGAGTSLARFDNTQYARNLFAWLAAAGGQYGDACATAAGLDPELVVAGMPIPGATIRLKVQFGPPGAPVALLLGLGQAEGLKVGLCPLLVWPILGEPIFLQLGSSGPSAGKLNLPVFLPADLPLSLFTVQAFLPGSGPGGKLAASNAVALFVH
jgi:hypothetical protein